jgi:hypothetical protein
MLQIGAAVEVKGEKKRILPNPRALKRRTNVVFTDLVESSVEGAPGLPDAVLPYLVPHVGMGGGQVTLLLVRLLQVARVLSPELLVQRARDQTPAKVFVLIRFKHCCGSMKF